MDSNQSGKHEYDRDHLTKEEAQFVYDHLATIAVPISHPNHAEVHRIGGSLLEKLLRIMETEDADQ